MGKQEPGRTRARGWRSTRALLLFVIMLGGLAAGGVYSATAVLVHVDNVILPGVHVGLPAPVSRVLPNLVATPPQGSSIVEPIKVLILGIDRRPHHDPKLEGATNSDSMHYLSIDPVTRTGAMISLPRDLYVEIPSPEKKGEFWEGRINSAYALGEQYKYPGGGGELARRTVEHNFHLPVDYYVVVDWVAFAEVIDALHGVWINVPVELHNVEGFNPYDGNAFTLTIPAGWQYLDGVSALAYARFRDDEQNDFGRIRRQQEVMRAAMDEAQRRGWLAQALPLYSRFRQAVDTDLSVVRLPGLLNLARMVGLDNVKMVSAAGEQTEAVRRVITPYGEDVLVPVWEKMAPIIRNAQEDRALTAEGARVKVVNATGMRGQEQRAAAYLSRFGVPPERIGPAPAQPAAVAAAATTVVYSGEARDTARRIAQWLGVPDARVSRVDSETATEPTVTVTLARDIRLPDDDRFQNFRAR